jgi:hypothetical protein
MSIVSLRSTDAQIWGSRVVLSAPVAPFVTRQMLAAAQSRNATAERSLARRPLEIRSPTAAIWPSKKDPLPSAALICVKNVQSLEVLIIVSFLSA